MNKKVLALIAGSSLLLTACFETGGTKETIGGITGAVIGGYAGSKVGGGSGQIVAASVGTLLGALAGSNIGRTLDRADMMYMDRATSKAHSAPVGESISWNNPDSGNSGTITPVKDGRSSSGRYCREYSQTIFVDGKKQTGYGTACKNPDGTWQVVN
jgi:surface antigen